MHSRKPMTEEAKAAMMAKRRATLAAKVPEIVPTELSNKVKDEEKSLKDKVSIDLKLR